jgi:hypothetical protein
VPLFDPTSSVAEEALAFLYAACGPALASLIGEKKYSNRFIQSLVSAADRALESDTPYVRVAVLSVLVRIVAAEPSASNLNDPVGTGDGSFGDLLLNGLIRVSTRRLWGSFGRVFHAAAPSLSSILPATAKAVLQFFREVVDAGDATAVLFVEAFALCVQVGRCRALLVEIFRAREVVAGLVGGGRIPAARAIVERFADAVEEEQDENGGKIARAVAAVDKAALFPDVELFPRRAYEISIDTHRAVEQWIDGLIARKFAREHEGLAKVGPAHK